VAQLSYESCAKCLLRNEPPMTDLPDELKERILVVRCQVGDESAFSEIVSSYGTRLRYYLLKLLGNPEAVEDTLQEVWLDLYRGFPRLRQPEAFRPWLYRITRDHAYRVLRKGRRIRRLVVDVEPPSDVIAVEDEGFSMNDAPRIHSALGRLSPAHREVLVLRFIEDLSYEEIAQVTRCELGTVKSRIYYAKRLLREEMEGQVDHE
jgi:RNA polymerase sigma-70 factor (ECF subfamily)